MSSDWHEGEARVVTLLGSFKINRDSCKSVMKDSMRYEYVPE